MGAVTYIDVRAILDQELNEPRCVAAATHAAHVQRAGAASHDEVGERCALNGVEALEEVPIVHGEDHVARCRLFTLVNVGGVRPLNSLL